MARVTFRSDVEVDRALAGLPEGDEGLSQVTREAVLLAWRTRQEERLLAEAKAVAADSADRDEARAVITDMHELRG